jgi:hypothetical protein
MLLLSTDGYSNSFASPDAFLKAGADYLNAIRTEGAEGVRKELPKWLVETSENGSGDDITVGIIYRRPPSLKNSENRAGKARHRGMLARAWGWWRRTCLKLGEIL